MRMRQLTSELRGRDLTLARLLEDKMRLLCEMLEELGVETQPPPFQPTPMSTWCRSVGTGRERVRAGSRF